MTYVLGVQKRFKTPGGIVPISAIFSDLMVTKKDLRTGMIDSSRMALKTDLLFEGCIFGMSGHEPSGRRFIIDFKKQIKTSNSIKTNWELFQDYIRSKPATSRSDSFELILSYRGDGFPLFYVYDSYRRSLVSRLEQEISIGSGKEVLDPLVDEFVTERESKIIDDFIQEGIRGGRKALTDYFYFLSLWLTEVSMGFEVSQLEKYGVGGVFSFYIQTPFDERRQEPSVYVLHWPDIKNNTVYAYSYRLLFIDDFLVVLLHSRPRPQVIYPLFNPRYSGPLTEAELDRIDEGILRRAYEKQEYFFCGFGFADPDFRGRFICHISPHGDHLAINSDGEIDKKYQGMLDYLIDRALEKSKQSAETTADNIKSETE